MQKPRNFQNRETFGLRMQMRRSAVNVASHIAEGHGRLNDSKMRKASGVARGSLNELQTQLELAARPRFLQRAASEQADRTSEREVAKLINGLIGVLDCRCDTSRANLRTRQRPAQRTLTREVKTRQ